MNSQKWNFEKILSGSPARSKRMLTTKTPGCTRSRPVTKWLALENKQGIYQEVSCQFSATVTTVAQFYAPHVKFDQTNTSCQFIKKLECQVTSCRLATAFISTAGAKKIGAFFGGVSWTYCNIKRDFFFTLVKPYASAFECRIGRANAMYTFGMGTILKNFAGNRQAQIG